MSDTQKIIEIEVLRYLPESDKEPHREVYKVAFTDDMSVLQGAQYIKDNFDGSLTYRWSCRMAICGSCGMMINGIPKLSCETFLRDYYPNRISIEALAHFPIEKDLVVDLSGFIEKLESIQPYIIPKEPRTLEQGEYLQSPQQFNDYIQFTSCINCTLCYAACPQVGLNPDFIGPGAMALLHRYNMDSRDGGAGRPLDAKMRRLVTGWRRVVMEARDHRAPVATEGHRRRRARLREFGRARVARDRAPDAGGFAEDRAHEIEVVDRVHEDLHPRHPAEEGPGLPRHPADDAHLEVDRLADRARREERAQRDDRRRMPELEVHRAADPARPEPRAQRGRLDEVGAEGLLDEYPRALRQRVERRGDRGGGQREIEDAAVVACRRDERRERGKGACTREIRHLRRARPVEIEDARDADPVTEVRRHMRVAHDRARADEVDRS